MPGVNWIPLLSQMKAGFQFITGDVEGAFRTFEDFFYECPGISQVVSLGQLITGDIEGALETQRRCIETISTVADGIPVVGHVKGVAHHAFGDYEKGNRALNAASRHTVIIGSGFAAVLATGGLGAIPLGIVGITAGGSYDLAHSAITDKPQGLLAGVEKVIENPSAGNIFDTVMIPVGDSIGGYAGGKIRSAIGKNIKISSLKSQPASAISLAGHQTVGTSSASQAQYEVDEECKTFPTLSVLTDFLQIATKPQTHSQFQKKIRTNSKHRAASPTLSSIESAIEDLSLTTPCVAETVLVSAHQLRGGGKDEDEGKRPIKVYSANVNSLRKRIEEKDTNRNLRNRVNLIKPHVICVQETKISVKTNDSDVEIKVSSDIEGIMVKILHDGLFISCFSLYRPPSTNKHIFLPNAIRFLYHCNCTLFTYNIVAGDFNMSINYESPKTEHSEAIGLYLFALFDIWPEIYAPTHGERSIDQILIPARAYDIKAILDDPLEKKHKPVVVQFKLPIGDYINEPIQERFHKYYSALDKIKDERLVADFSKELVKAIKETIKEHKCQM